MANEVQIGDQFTNGRETLTIKEINPKSGRVKFQFNWNDTPHKYWAAMGPILKGYTKVEVKADEYDLGEWVPTGETLDEVIARDLACKR